MPGGGDVRELEEGRGGTWRSWPPDGRRKRRIRSAARRGLRAQRHRCHPTRDWRASGVPAVPSAALRGGQAQSTRSRGKLLDLGCSPDVESPAGERALHIAAYHDAVDVGEILIARGAEVDPIGHQ